MDKSNTQDPSRSDNMWNHLITFRHNTPKQREMKKRSNLSFEALQPRNKAGETRNGDVFGPIVISQISHAGDDGGDLFLQRAVIGADRLLVMLERYAEELVLKLDRFRQLTRSRRRDGPWRSDRGRGLRHHGVGVSVSYRIDFHGEVNGRKELPFAVKLNPMGDECVGERINNTRRNVKRRRCGLLLSVDSKPYGLIKGEPKECWFWHLRAWIVNIFFFFFFF